ncbi:hypothetical protein CBM2634_A160050 [Cupriavidus taiwanensis]|uniref:Uncharacterized protein n=1 Tax=Cupriavidus taiwanensis TaxID=164546 RepID=A0A375IVL6_9BURK|nr:hypothetical protein CBM2634_A160050 [Cupriavidus taiwanensis]
MRDVPGLRGGRFYRGRMACTPSIGAGSVATGRASFTLSQEVGGQHADRAGARLTAETVGLRGRLPRRKFVSARHLPRLSRGTRR